MSTRNFTFTDHLDRTWIIRARRKDATPSQPPSAWLEVRITCDRTPMSAPDTRIVLDKKAAWHPVHGWDMTRAWYPRSPRPVPEKAMHLILRGLRKIAPELRRLRV